MTAFFDIKTPFPTFPQGGRSIIFSPLGEIRKGVNSIVFQIITSY